MSYYLAENEKRPMTRRIPALPRKNLERDSKIISQLIRAYDVENDIQKVKDIFFRKCRLLSNPRYWEVLRTVWVIAGSTETSDEFRPYLKALRPCKGWFMTVEDSEALEKMEFPLTDYRAYDPYYDTPKGLEAGGDPGISWTTDKEWCEEYAKGRGRIVKSRTVERKDVFAYISRRGEEEIMIL